MHFFESLLSMLNGMSPYILLGFFIAGLLHVFVKPSLMSRHLAGKGIKPVVKSALFGIPLPLCSCGVLPTAVSLKRNGASTAASTSFLIATPQTGVDSIAATYSLLGPAMAVTRPLAALVCSVFGGLAVGKWANDEGQHEEEDTHEHDHCGCGDHHDGTCCSDEEVKGTFWQKLFYALKYGFVDMVQHVGKWLVIGLIIAALITVFVPDDLFLGLAEYPLLAMIVMVLVAVPMYICATGSIPIALSLMIKGLTPGVGFVLLMAGPAANFASVMVLRRSMGNKATFIYIASVVITALAVGLIIDYLLPRDWFIPSSMTAACCHTHTFGWFDSTCSAVLVMLLIYAFIKNNSLNHKHLDTQMKRAYNVKGMMCPHCQANVQKGLEKLPGVEAVVVNLDKGTAEVAGDVAPEAVISAIKSLGYDVVAP